MFRRRRPAPPTPAPAGRYAGQPTAQLVGACVWISLTQPAEQQRAIHCVESGQHFILRQAPAWRSTSTRSAPARLEGGYPYLVSMQPTAHHHGARSRRSASRCPPAHAARRGAPAQCAYLCGRPAATAGPRAVESEGLDKRIYAAPLADLVAVCKPKTTRHHRKPYSASNSAHESNRWYAATYFSMQRAMRSTTSWCASGITTDRLRYNTWRVATTAGAVHT